MTVTPKAQKQGARTTTKRASGYLGGHLGDPLVWLVDFSRTQPADIEALKEKDLEGLEVKVREFAFGLKRGPVLMKSPGRIAVALSPSGQALGTMVLKSYQEGLVKLARFARNKLDDFMRLDIETGRGTVIIEPGQFGRLTICLERTRDGHLVKTREGDRDALFAHQVAEVLAAEGMRLACCASSDCERLFVKRKQQAYCSERCSKRERQRRFREGLSLEQRYQSRADRYLKSVDHEIKPRGPRKARQRLLVAMCPSASCGREFQVKEIPDYVQCPGCKTGFMAAPGNTRWAFDVPVEGKPAYPTSPAA